MSDFDLADALDRSSHAELGADTVQATPANNQSEQTELFEQTAASPSPGFAGNRVSEMESGCFNMKDVKKEVFSLSKDLDLEVSHNRRTMQTVANLVLVVNWMNRSLTGSELCSTILDHVVEETIVKTDWKSSRGHRGAQYKRVNSDGLFVLSDSSKKNLVGSTEMKLQAITLKGGASPCTVNFKMTSYIGNYQGDSQTVLLSIPSNLHISCCETDNKVTLHLESCCKEKLMDISEDDDMDRFLFIKRTQGQTLTTFESLKHRGWFISTSSEDTNPSVEMCRVDASHRCINFSVFQR